MKSGFPGSSAGKEYTCKAGDPGSIPGTGRFLWEGIGYLLQYSWAFLVAQSVKNSPAMREIRVWSGLGDPPGGHGKSLQYSCLENPCGQSSLAGYSPWDRKEWDTMERLSTQHTHEINCCHNDLRGFLLLKIHMKHVIL